MNYAEAERIKIWGRAKMLVDDTALFEKLSDPHYDARVEQAIVFRVTAWDANCPQHMPRLIHAGRVERAFEILQRRLRYLETTLTNAGIAFAPEQDPSVRRSFD